MKKSTDSKNAAKVADADADAVAAKAAAEVAPDQPCSAGEASLSGAAVAEGTSGYKLQPKVPTAFTEPLIPESEWAKAGDSSYVLIEDPMSPRGPLQHGRSLPLPLRVKTGKLHEDRLVLETAAEVLEIPWKRVKFVTLGMVFDKVETEASTYQIQKLAAGVGRMMKGGASPGDGKIVSYRETNLVDLFVDGLPEPIRFDSSLVNYRSLLPQLSYVSFQNFFRLVHTLCEHCTEARFTSNVQYFLVWKRDFVQRFSALHEYEEDCMIRFGQLEKQVAWSELDFSRSTWAQEWSDD